MQDSFPRVSIIILNWNGKDLLPSCLESLRRQTFRDFEIILVDNGSTDGSVPWVQQHFPGVRVCALERNLGFAGGNNVGIRQARGMFIALLNNDTESDVRWLEELMKALAAHPEAGFCASKLVFYHQRNLIDTAGDYFSIAGSAGKLGHLDQADKPEYNQLREVFGACAGAALYRKEMLDEIGLFDEDFFVSFEDVDLSFRAQLKGYKCLYVPTAIVRHRVHGTIQKNSPAYVYYGHRNLEYVYLKNMPGSLIVKYFLLHVLEEMIAFGFFLTQGRGLDFLKGKWDALRALPKLLDKRRQIQQSRSVSTEYIRTMMRRDWWSLKWARWRRLRDFAQVGEDVEVGSVLRGK